MEKREAATGKSVYVSRDGLPVPAVAIGLFVLPQQLASPASHSWYRAQGGVVQRSMTNVGVGLTWSTISSLLPFSFHVKGVS